MIRPEYYERLSGDVAQLAAAETADTDDEDDVFRPEITPIAEGEVTLGKSEKKTEWERNPLKAATEAGAFDNAKILKGRPGDNPHKPITEQAPPDDIVGGAGTFRYEDGKGPVSNGDGVITDDHIATLIDHDLVEISPDTLRKLGEFDEGLAEGEGAHSVEEIIDVPWMTIVDRGAGQSADISRADAEALAALPEYDDLEENVGGEHLAGLELLRFWPTPISEFEAEPLSAFEDTAQAVDAIDGVRSLLDTHTNDDGDVLDAELFAILEPDAVDLGSLNESLRDALAETPFEVGDGYNWVTDIEHEHLAEHRDSDERADTRTGSPEADDRTSNESDTMTDDIEELREQLAAAEAENDKKDAQIENLEEETEELEDENESLEDEKDTLESDLEETEEQNEVFHRSLAQQAAEDSPLSADQIAKAHDTDDLVEALDDGPDGEDDDRTPQERMSEQLAAGLDLRGGGGDDAGGAGGSAGGLSDEDIEEAEQLAGTVLDVNDVQRINGEGLSKRDFLKREHDVDPAEYGSEDSLRQAIDEGGD